MSFPLPKTGNILGDGQRIYMESSGSDEKGQGTNCIPTRRLAFCWAHPQAYDEGVRVKPIYWK